MLLACLITFWHMLSHVKRSANKPSVKRRILAILWMVPIYSFFRYCVCITLFAYGFQLVSADI